MKMIFEDEKYTIEEFSIEHMSEDGVHTEFSYSVCKKVKGGFESVCTLYKTDADEFVQDFISARKALKEIKQGCDPSFGMMCQSNVYQVCCESLEGNS